MMQFRIPFLPSERRKPCSARALLDEDMIFVQGISREVVAFQVMQVNVTSCRNFLFGGTNRNTTLKYLFSCLNIPDRNLATDCNILSEYHFLPIKHFSVPRPYRRDDDQHVVVAMNAQQLS